MKTQVISLEDALQEDSSLDGAVIFDGDGDGTSAAAIWLATQPEGKYVAITNPKKSERDIVREVLQLPKLPPRVGIFDLDTESNLLALEELSQRNTEVTFMDHHTRDSSLLPREIVSYVQADGRKNCTATIAYEFADTRGYLDEPLKKSKAIQLAIVGLANDGKGTAARKFGGNFISPEERETLINHAQAINFGAARGSLDGARLLNFFLECESPLQALIQSQEITQLITLRDETIESVNRGTKVCEEGHLRFYLFPTEGDAIDNCLDAYNEIMNGHMQEEPDQVHIGVLRTREGYRFVGRWGNGNVRGIMDKLARVYGFGTAKGRETAAGFDTSSEIDNSQTFKNVRGAYNETL